MTLSAGGAYDPLEEKYAIASELVGARISIHIASYSIP